MKKATEKKGFPQIPAPRQRVTIINWFDSPQHEHYEYQNRIIKRATIMRWSTTRETWWWIIYTQIDQNLNSSVIWLAFATTSLLISQEAPKYKEKKKMYSVVVLKPAKSQTHGRGEVQQTPSPASERTKRQMNQKNKPEFSYFTIHKFMYVEFHYKTPSLLQFCYQFIVCNRAVHSFINKRKIRCRVFQ